MERDPQFDGHHRPRQCTRLQDEKYMLVSCLLSVFVTVGLAVILLQAFVATHVGQIRSDSVMPSLDGISCYIRVWNQSRSYCWRRRRRSRRKKVWCHSVMTVVASDIFSVVLIVIERTCFLLKSFLK